MRAELCLNCFSQPVQTPAGQFAEKTVFQASLLITVWTAALQKFYSFFEAAIKGGGPGVLRVFQEDYFYEYFTEESQATRAFSCS